MAEQQEVTDEQLREIMDKPACHKGWRKRIKAYSTGLTEDKKELYLRALDLSGQRGLAARAADVCSQTVRNHEEDDPEFSSAVQEVLTLRSQRIVERLENEFVEGHFEPIVNKDGEVVGERKKVETQGRIKVIQRHDKAYRDKQEIDVNQTGGVLVVNAQSSVEDWVKDARKLKDQMMDKGYIEGDGEPAE